ncbi:MAG: 50S ribosomal protein L22 [Candidatus Yanofskybacteria bacterium CG10_big_fil_rev_8_21_14_0_10_46_23]|uniref:Large ribosomal subunit protein uL22 n=1 Tax=Candidatus Yanofskybacteria bacterium CG10_big_fil_rev_8_21_14_0_10_46_23 TaxID=1975098 RepID=A0A2H0R3V1_9BACT|nr:MAG: 50S ribosomal protein L22 [Candidatus Yanofskybacteria bacterium CG10_big_fil_rev_8_21_14_0_10_46_23]
MAQVIAKAKHLHIAPRKVRFVAEPLKGLQVKEAQVQLTYIVNRSAVPLAKLLKSAVANAENNFSMVQDNLFIKNITVDEGVTIKRFRPKGFGRVSPINRKTSHITITLDEKVAGVRQTEKLKSKPVEPEKIESPAEGKAESLPKPKTLVQPKTKTAKPISKENVKQDPSFVKRIFRRKV